jgi:hypothetical protein
VNAAALAGGKLAPWMDIAVCSSGTPSCCSGPAVAIWESPNSHARSPLCNAHVDRWFDVCDDDPELEPASVRWLDGSRVLVGAA